MFDKKGTIKSFSAKSSVKRALAQMGVDTDQFLKSRPTLHKLEWNGNEVPCGGIVEDHFGAITEAIRDAASRSPIIVNVTFIASAIEMEEMVINKDLECKINFITSCGAVFTQIPESSPLRYSKEKKRRKVEETEQLPFHVSAGTRIRKINKSLINAESPLESFVTHFENRMFKIEKGSDPQDSFSLTVQTPLHVDDSPPCIVALFSKALLKAAKIIKSSNTAEQDKVVSDNSGFIPYPTLVALQTQAVSNSDLIQLLSDPFVLDWALVSMGKGIQAYTNSGSLGGVIEPSEADTDSLIEYVHTQIVGVRRRRIQGDKLKNLKINVTKEYAAVSENFKQPGKTGCLYIAEKCNEIFTQGSCPACKADIQSANHQHEEELILYGNMYRIDMAKYSPITLFLDRLGWRSWPHVDFIFPIDMLPERIDSVKSTGFDIRFRAVVTRSQLQFFEEIYRNELVATLQRHFHWDLTGDVIRKEWSWDERKRTTAESEVIIS